MAYRRRVGVGGGRAGAASKYNKKAEEMREISVTSAMETVKKLETKLADFAKKHKHEIQTDPAFRSRFLEMCGPLGVDPLSSEKGFWGGLGLGIGEFYYELAVKVAEVCLASRARNGGIISVSEVRRILRSRGTKFKLAAKSSGGGGGGGGGKNSYSEDDIVTAISKLSKLGSGFRTVQIGDMTMIVSVPTELDGDHMEVMRIALDGGDGGRSSSSRGGPSPSGMVTLAEVRRVTGWTDQRARRALDLLLGEGMAWLDSHEGQESYWFPSVWKEGFDMKV